MILFRDTNDPRPPWLEPIHWQVEYWDDEAQQGQPNGIAFVTAGEAFQCVDYILVCDECRRQGIATKLVKACEERWPNIMLTDAISEMGESFLRSLEADDA